MRVVVQRVLNAKCTVNNNITGNITNGYLLLVGFTNGDNLESIKKAAKKIVNLRIFEDENQKMNLNIKQVNGSILSISQFTLYANTDNGNRPSFIDSLNHHDADNLYHLFNNELQNYDIKVETGIFGEHMELEFINDGPVTIILDF
jgi:D-tyrosyl-tRNA(Tyr) deacylase